MIKIFQRKINPIIRNILYIILLLLSIPSAAGFELDENFRNNLNPIINELCHSSIQYVITDTVETKTTEYNQLINCLVNESLEKSTVSWNRFAEKQASESAKKNIKFQKFDRTDKDLCKEKRYTLEHVQTAQQQKPETSDTDGFKSICRESGGFAAKRFSACQLAETTQIERCGQQLFLLAKANDFKSFRAEQKFAQASIIPTAHANRQLYQIQNNFSGAQTNYYQEIYASETALTETLEFVRQYQKNYHQHIWWQIFNQESKVIFTQTKKIAVALFTFVRFVNATMK